MIGAMVAAFYVIIIPGDVMMRYLRQSTSDARVSYRHIPAIAYTALVLTILLWPAMVAMKLYFTIRCMLERGSR
jgi:hypothetical protein